MELRDSEKLILLMLSEIYEHHKIRGEIDPKFVKETIFSGNYWGFELRYSGLFRDEAPTKSIVDETFDILTMWSLLETSYSKLSPEDQQRVHIEIPHLGDSLQFEGFDANHEDHYGVALYIVNTLGRYNHFKDRDMDSHSASIEIYRRMLRAFNPMRQSFGNDFTADRVIAILKETIHPSNR
jgi:uncharacterized protein YfbU (UPF0304 family)